MTAELPFMPFEEMLGCAPGKPKVTAVWPRGVGLITPSVMRNARPGELLPQ